MNKKMVAALMVVAVASGSLAGCGSKSSSSAETSGEEGKVLNIYSWNEEFRERLEAVYPEVESTSEDGTVTTLKDGTEIHWIIILIRMVYISRNWMKHYYSRQTLA